jgi:adenylate kinase
VAGLPGSGKGTLCAQLAADLGVAHLSIGDALRQEADHRTPFGARARGYLRSGRLVPDRLVLELITARLARCQHASAVLLDGFPRTVAQAEALECVQPGSVALTVFLVVPLVTIRERLRTRRRVDDAPSALRERLLSFERDTRPMLAWYGERGCLRSVDADRPPSDVTIAVKELIATFVAPSPTLSDASVI